MHSCKQCAHSFKSRIWLRHFLKDALKDITSPDNWSFLLKLTPSGFSFWLTSLLMVFPTMSPLLAFCNAYLNRSFTLARKWDTGSSSPKGGGKRRTVSCVPIALDRLYYLLISPSIVNLGGAISSSFIVNLRAIFTLEIIH
jgi:hypothetical protein